MAEAGWLRGADLAALSCQARTPRISALLDPDRSLNLLKLDGGAAEVRLQPLAYALKLSFGAFGEQLHDEGWFRQTLLDR